MGDTPEATWEAMFRAYLSGRDELSIIAQRFQVLYSAVSERARREKWAMRKFAEHAARFEALNDPRLGSAPIELWELARHDLAAWFHTYKKTPPAYLELPAPGHAGDAYDRFRKKQELRARPQATPATLATLARSAVVDLAAYREKKKAEAPSPRGSLH